MEGLFKTLILSMYMFLSLESIVFAQNKEVKPFIESYYQTMSDRNWKKYAGFFSDDATLTTIWAIDSTEDATITSFTIDEFLAQTKNGPDSQPIFEEKPLHITVEQNENMASVWVKYVARFGSQDNLMKWKGYDLFTLIYFNGRWIIVSLAYISTQD